MLQAKTDSSTKMSNQNASSPIKAEKLALIISNPDPDIATARKTAQQLDAHLPRATAWDYMIPPTGLTGASLLQSSPNPRVPYHPEALFLASPGTALIEYEPWEDAQLAFLRRWAHGQNLASLHAKLKNLLAENGQADHLPDMPAFVAGLLLYVINPSPASPLRRGLLDLAMRMPAGAYFASESMTLPEERVEIVARLRKESHLVFWASRIAGFQKLCCSAATGHYDLWGALTLLLSETPNANLETWARELVYRAFVDADAAGAALIFVPGVAPEITRAWLQICAREPRCAYETARYAGVVGGGSVPIDQLRGAATADRGRYWCAWYRDVEPHRSQEALDCDAAADLLWACELLESCNLKHGALSARLLEGNHAGGDAVSDAILSFLRGHTKRQRV